MIMQESLQNYFQMILMNLFTYQHLRLRLLRPILRGFTQLLLVFIIEAYSVYDIIQVIPDEAVGYKSLKKNIQAHLDKISETIKANDEENFMNKVKSLADYFGYETKDSHLKKLYKTIIDEDNHHYFCRIAYKIFR